MNTNKNAQNVVIKKEYHSRGMLSGISRIRLRKQAGTFCLKTTKQKGDPQQQLLGMTPYFTAAHGFTLIELLVVVLIIGILAAVALPQYKLAVVKSRVATMLSLGTAIREAEEVYYLSNGTYTTDVANLDVDIPGECTMAGKDTGTPEEENIGRYWKCGNDFLVELSPDDGFVVNYCPHNNTSWQECSASRDFVVFTWYAHSSNFNKGKIKCYKQNSSSLGQKLCTTLVLE